MRRGGSGWGGGYRVFPIAVSFQLKSREAAEDLSEAELLVIWFPLPGLELGVAAFPAGGSHRGKQRRKMCRSGIIFSLLLLLLFFILSLSQDYL